MSYFKNKMETFSDMRKGNPYKLLLTFTMPLLIGNIFQQLYNIVDSIVVGRNVGNSGLAAVGASFPFFFLILSVFIGFGIGAMIIVSQIYGRKDYDSLQSFIDTIYKMLFYITVPLTLIGVIFSKPVLILLNVGDDNPETLYQASIYLQIIFIGIIGQLGFNINAGFLQGMGDSLSSLLFLSISTVINIVLDIVFTTVIPWGTAGVALATVIAQNISWLYGIYYINKKYKNYIHISFFRLQFNWHLFKQAVRLGLPAGIQQVLYALGSLVLMALINSNGYIFTAGYTSATKVDSFVFLPILSLGTAISTYIGQNIVDGIGIRVKSGIKAALVLMMFFSAFTGIMVYFLQIPLLKLFSPDNQIIITGSYYLSETMPFYIFIGIIYGLNAIYQGAGNTVMPMISSVLGQCILRIPIAYFIVYISEAKYMYYAYSICWIIAAFIVSVYYISGYWKKHIKVIKNYTTI